MEIRWWISIQWIPLMPKPERRGLGCNTLCEHYNVVVSPTSSPPSLKNMKNRPRQIPHDKLRNTYIRPSISYTVIAYTCTHKHAELNHDVYLTIVCLISARCGTCVGGCDAPRHRHDHDHMSLQVMPFHVVMLPLLDKLVLHDRTQVYSSDDWW